MAKKSKESTPPTEKKRRARLSRSSPTPKSTILK